MSTYATKSLHQRVAALSPKQRKTLAQQLAVAKSQQAPARLVAYIVPQPATTPPPNETELRAALKSTLPAYMVPSAIVPLARIPRTPNGKVDIKSLPTPQAPLSATEHSSTTKPQTPTEEALCEIWQAVLGVQTVGVHDDFFELGGDSILSIQIVSKARELGLRLAPNQLFEQSTIAELASVVNSAPQIQAAQDIVTGPVPLTPIQHWFFEQQMVAPQHWHQAVLLELPPSVGFEQVKAAIATLWTHHDALRLRFHRVQTVKPEWQQTNADANTPPQPLNIDVSSLSITEQHQAVKHHGNHLHANLNLADGDALQSAYFTRGKNTPAWLLISLHHLVVDGVSWQIINHDLKTLLSPAGQTSQPQTTQPQTTQPQTTQPQTTQPQTTQPQTTQLPEKTTSFKLWAETLTAQANSQKSELTFWLNQLASNSLALPQDLLQNAAAVALSTEGTSHTLTVTLGVSKTHDLLKTVPAAYNTQVNDVLLTALAQTTVPWIQNRANATQLNSVRIDIESHGRQQLAGNIDLSRTVGWFTAVYPLSLQLQSPDDIGSSLKAIKEQLRQVPNKGIGYSLLRYLSDDNIQQQLAQFSPSEILFNYLGQREAGEPVIATAPDNEIRIIQDLDLGTLRHPDNCRSYLLEINCWVSQGQFHMNWTYDTQRYDITTVEEIASRYLYELNSIISHCISVKDSGKHGGFTPSDFPGLHITQSELDTFIQQLKPNLAPDNIESIYPLAPLQEAFLWHSLQDSSQAGLLHMRGTLHGELDFGLLQQAWNTVIDCHAALRASVHWQQVPKPLQVTAKKVPLPWQQLDWRETEDVQQAMVCFLESDRTLGFDFTQSPITRLTLIRLADTVTEMVWSCHHLMLDGWSGTLVFNQVLAAYETLKKEKPLSTKSAVGYPTYIHWLNQQDTAVAEHFWRAQLEGFTSPTPLPIALDTLHDKEAETPSTDPVSKELSVEVTQKLQSFLKSQRLTLNTLIQGTWALLLHIYSNNNDILFGATISGRQADLDQIESIVGLLTNVLPVRVQISPQSSVASWLAQLQTQQAETSRFAYASTAQTQTWSDCLDRLFNSLLVIENYPANAPLSDKNTEQSLRLENLQSGIISTYGLTIIVKPGADETSGLALFASAQNAETASLEILLTGLRSLLTKIIQNPDTSLHKLLTSSEITTLTGTLQNSTAETAKTMAVNKADSNRSRSQKVNPVDTLPRTPLELKLIQIWESVGLSPCNTESNFFELGGDSILAVQLFNQMQQKLECNLPLASLFSAPTIRQLATLISQKRPGSQWSSLVPIQPNGSQRPFFFHGGSADALTWAKFSQLLGTDQPFYALQRPDLNGHNIVDSTVEELATACIQDIKTIQPQGPYIVGGHCFGGAVAFEIARQLQAQGDNIQALIEIDAYCPNALPPTTIGQLQEQTQLTYFLLQKSYYYHGGRNLAQLPKKLWHRLSPPKRQQPPTHSINTTPPPPTSPPQPHPPSPTPPSPNSLKSSHSPSPLQQSAAPPIPYEQRYAQAHQANLWAAEQYTPQTNSHYSGPLKIFCATTQILDWRYGPQLGWQTVATPPIDTTRIPGIFGNLFNQQSGPRLAQQVKAYLDSLQ